MKQKQLRYFSRDLSRTTLLAWKAGKGMALANLALQFIQALLPVASLYLIKALIEKLSGPGKSDLKDISYIIIEFVAVQLLAAAASQFSAFINTLQQQKISDLVAGMVLDKAVSVNLEYYENPEYHDNLHMAQQQSQYRVPQLVTNMNTLLLNSFSLLMLVGFFFTLQWSYALLFLLLSMPLAGIRWYYSYQLYRLEKKFVPLEREAGYLHQVLTGIGHAKETRVFGFATAFIERFKSMRASVYEGKRKLNVRLTNYSLLTQIVEAVVMALIFLSLAGDAWAGRVTLGVFIIYIQGFQRLQSSSRSFLQSFVQIFQQRLFLKDLFSFFDIPANDQAEGATFPTIKKGLTVNHLSFTYPDTTKTVLKEISITCEPGKVIAIVGENGSGKSTLVKLLARLYDTPGGDIKVDGVDTHSLSNDSFRANTFFLFQDFEKYFLTVEENITLAGTKEKKITPVAAARLAGADGFISALPNGYKTRLGRVFDGSEELSGGQWQKLALARAFYKDAAMIVMDEPTSAIDAIAEHEIFKNIKAHAEGKIVILISHTLYNLKIADHIYVMDDGAIVEQGDFDTLINGNGIFKKMFDNQKI